jgi:hypothetical protein
MGSPGSGGSAVSVSAPAAGSAPGRGLDRVDQRLDALHDRVVPLARLDQRDHRRADHRGGGEVGDGALEAVADLDPHRVVVGHGEHGEAVVAASLAELPRGE